MMWSPRQLRRAHRLRERGCANADIAQRLQRTERAIACKLSLYSPDGTRKDVRPRIGTATMVAELRRQGWTCTPPEHGPARVDL